MLRRLLTPRDEVRASSSSEWGDWAGDVSGTWSGQRVDRSSSLQLLAVYGCTRFIGDSIATLPVDVYERNADGTRTEVPAPDWIVQPTSELTFVAWCTQVLSSLLLDGNAYIAVTYNALGRVVELVPIDAQKVTVRRVGTRKVYDVNGAEHVGKMLHIPALMLAGADVGLSPIEYARQTVGLGLATIEHGARFFGQGVTPGGVITYPTEQPPEKKRDLATQFARKHANPRNAYHLPAVLDGGATWIPPAVTNEQAQFLETRGYTATEIAGQMFLVDPSELGLPVQGTALTYANLLERSTRRVQVTFLPWIVRIERALSSLLAPPFYVKLNVDAYLRASVEQRFRTYQLASAINVAAAGLGMPPVLTTQEMRGYEDLPPLNMPTSEEPPQGEQE